MITNATTKRHRDTARRLFNAFINALSLGAQAATRPAHATRTTAGRGFIPAPAPVRVATAPGRDTNTRVRR